MALRWAEALRRFARWQHEIVVMGDECLPAKKLARLGVRCVDLRPRVRAIPEWHRDRATCLKPWILDHIDASAFDFLLSLDCDVIAATPRLEALLADKAARGVIAVQQDIIGVSKNVPCTGRRTLTDEEKARFPDVAICAGIVGVPTAGPGLELLRDWRRAIEEAGYPRPPGDQPLLYPLLLRKFLGRWEYIGDSVIGRRVDHPETLIHFTNRGGMVEKRAGREDRLFFETFDRLELEARSSAA